MIKMPESLRKLEAFLTGSALAHLQVAIGFAAMRGLGASASAWFAVLFCWLLGGLCGTLLAKRGWLTSRRESTLSLSTLLFLMLTEAATLLQPFSVLPRFAIALAAGLSGGYGGAFLASRGSQGASIAALFFHENNGFLFGFVIASGVLLLHAPLLLPLTTLGVLAARAAAPHRQSGPLLFAVILGILSASFQLLFAWGGEPAWDALMTASVLTHPDAVELQGWLFFAHPLVIPLTAPFRWFTSDPLQAVTLREAVCHGGVITLLYLGGRALAGTHRHGLLIALLAVLQVLLSVGRWQLALAGEEKEIAVLASSAFLFFYLDHRGLWSLHITSFSILAPRWRRFLLGALLALAMSIHIQNGLLVVWLLFDLLLTVRKPNLRRKVATDVVVVLVVSAALAGPFFVWLASAGGGARTPRELLQFYLEYHLSGEFFSIPVSLSDRLSECYRGLRLWLLGDLPFGSPRLEPVLGTLGLALLSLSALRQAPQVVSRLLAWPLLIFLHFFFYQPWHPEAWSPSAACGSLLVALGLLGRGRLLPLRCGLAVLWIAVLAFLLGRDQQQGKRLSEEVQAFVEADSLSKMPLRELTRWLDVNLEPEAEILVTDRLLVSYFQLYTKRVPMVREYLGVPKEALRGTYHLTTLSLRFYTPQRTPAEIDAAILAGRPVYLLSTESGSSQTVELPWGGLLLSRLTTPLGVRAETPLAPPSRTPVHATDLLSNDLTLTAATPINPSVYRLSLRNGERTFSAKWKPLGVQGSEEQEGFDGNNAPRCELAARRIDQFLSDGNPHRELVPEVVLRALHRQVPCDRHCQGIPQLISAEVPATFAAINDHLVLGALSLWIEDAERPTRFAGQLWSPQRFVQDPAYRRSFADLMTFLYLIAHGDANYADNFLFSEGPPPRAYSIDNGRSLDGIPFYTAEGDPDWQPLAQLTPQSLVAPALSRQTLNRVAALPGSRLLRSLYLVAAIDLRSGHTVSEPDSVPSLRRYVGRPLSSIPQLQKVSRQSYLTPKEGSDGPWLLLGVSESGTKELLARAAALLSQQRTTQLPLFD